MSVIKGLALSFLSFLLFLSLTLFGFAFILNSTLLNPDFITSELDKLDVSGIAQDIVDMQMAEGEGVPDELTTAILDTLPDLEPVLKEQVNATITDTYDYLLGNRDQPDLKTTLSDTFFNSDFVNSVLDKLDLALLLEQAMEGQTGEGDFPEEFTTALIDTISDHEAELKQRVAAATDPIFDYLLGETDSIDLALTLRNTVLSSDFVLSLINKVAIFSLASEALGGELTEQIPEEMQFLTEYLDDLMPEVESTIKQQISDNVDQLLDYLLGQRESISIVISLGSITETLEDSLKEHLREMTPAELEPYVEQIATEQITAVVPAELHHLVDQAITDEWVTQLANTATDPVLRYLLGDSPSLNVTVSLQPVVENMREPVKQEFMGNLPAELIGLPQSTIDQAFDDYYQELTQDIPSSITVDESILGADLPSQIDELFENLTEAMPTSFNIGETLAEAMPSNTITDALQEAEGGLADARQSIDKAITEFEDQLEQPLWEGGSSPKQIIGYFQLGYKIAIALIAVIILGIILIHRQVKGATRGLGVTFLTYGLINYVSIIVGKNIGGPRITDLISGGDIPRSLQDLPMQFVNAFTSPLQTFSLIVLIVGVVLVVTSFVYPRLRPSVAEDE